MRMFSIAGALAVAAMALVADLSAAGVGEFSAEIGRVQDYVAADAQGQATFKLSNDGSGLRYELTVRKLENFIQAHLHLTPDALTQESLLNRFREPSPEGGHGPIVVFLTDFMRGGVAADGVLAKGTITKSDLVGPLRGYPLSLLAELMARRDVYVALHVLQLVPPNNRFCCPVGLRGIIQAKGSQ